MKIAAGWMRARSGGMLGLLCLVALAGCSTNTSVANIVTSPPTLEMSVGTIYDRSHTLGVGTTSLNVVTSFRNVLGNSAYENPGQYALSGPGGTIQAAQPGNACDQLFSYGQFPGCLKAGAVINNAAIGGAPPTYSPANPNGVYAIGIIATGALAAGGVYTVSTVVPVNGMNQTFSQTATLPATPVMLGGETNPSFVTDGAGGGTF